MGAQSFAVFLAAILICAWYGGVGPALLSLVLLHVAHGYWFNTPRGLFQPNMASIVTTIAYYIVGILVGLLSQRQTAARRVALEQQHEAVSQREHLRATLLCMADGVLVTDTQGHVTLINPAAEGMTGWNTTDAKGKPWWEILALRRDDGEKPVERPIDRVLQERRVVHETMPQWPEISDRV
jgi:PAS domain-containing protein